MDKKLIYILLVAVVLLGGVLRIYNLGAESFWLDEGATFYAAQQGPSYSLENTYSKNSLVPEYFGHGGAEMPLYFLLSYYWTQLFGLSEFTLRLLPALFGIASIYLLFLVGRLLFNSEVGLLSAFILSINHQHISYSQEARQYALFILLALASVYFFLRSLQDNKMAYWAVYALASALLLYTHYFGSLILIFQLFYLLLSWKEYKPYLRNLLFSAAGILFLYLPWLPSLYRQFFRVDNIGQILGRPGIMDLAETFVGFSSWISPDLPSRIALRAFDIASLPLNGRGLILSVLLLAALYGIMFVSGLFRNGQFRLAHALSREKIFLLLWLGIPLLVPIVFSLLFPAYSVFKSIKYVLPASPAYYLLVSKGFFHFRKYMALLLSLAVLFSVLPLYSYYTNADKEQWKEAADYLSSRRESQEPVFLHAANTLLPFSYYHPDLALVYGVHNTSELIPLLEDRSQFWLVLSMDKFSDPEGKIKSYLDANYALIDQNVFTGVRVFRYAAGNPSDDSKII